MLVKSFLAWMEDASAQERGEAVSMLAQAYLSGALGADTPEAVEAALTLILDDPSPNVRRVLAMAFAERRDAPRHIVLHLARDQAEVSAMLIARSPLLTEADLVDLAGNCETLALCAIALRPDVTNRIAHALVEREEESSACTLVSNRTAEIAERDMLVMLEAFGQSARLRELMLQRGALPPSVRHRLMLAVAGNLGAYLLDGGFLDGKRNKRMLDETLQQGTIAIARGAADDLGDFVAYLRGTGQLTPGLLLRGGLEGDLPFIAAALAELCDMPRERVESILTSRSDGPISAIVRRAGLAAFLAPVMVAVIRAAAMLPGGERGQGLSLAVLHAAQAACAAVSGEDAMRLMALLRRHEADAARAQSRRMAEELRQSVIAERASIALLPLDIGPEMLRLSMAEDAAPAEPIEAEAGDAIAATRSSPARIMRMRGILLDEPIPDLKSLIAEWKAEHAARDVARSQALVEANRNGKPDRSRVA